MIARTTKDVRARPTGFRYYSRHTVTVYREYSTYMVVRMLLLRKGKNTYLLEVRDQTLPMREYTPTVLEQNPGTITINSNEIGRSAHQGAHACVVLYIVLRVSYGTCRLLGILRSTMSSCLALQSNLAHHAALTIPSTD